ncbi:MAG TPA: hypothetical protein VMP00_15150 [Burkholderiales bacterium]|nr:hypothetical protein [Burkholderiales bacterium]
MKTQTLASAFQAALTRGTENRTAVLPATRDELLLAAIQRSATPLDQIVSRRIGLEKDHSVCITP